MTRRGRSFSTQTERVEERGGRKFIRLKSGRVITFWDARTAVENAHSALSLALSRAFKLTSDDYDLERLEWLVDNLETHIRAVRREIERRYSVKETEERIKHLRNVTGREPAEAAAFLKKADELEAQLREDQ